MSLIVIRVIYLSSPVCNLKPTCLSCSRLGHPAKPMHTISKHIPSVYVVFGVDIIRYMYQYARWQKSSIPWSLSSPLHAGVIALTVAQAYTQVGTLLAEEALLCTFIIDMHWPVVQWLPAGKWMLTFKHWLSQTEIGRRVHSQCLEYRSSTIITCPSTLHVVSC